VKPADELLSGLPLFAGLDAEPCAAAFRETRLERRRAGDILCREGETDDRLQILVSGIVELSKTAGRRTCGVLILAPGDLIMPTAALFDEPFLASARALTSAQVASIPSALIVELAMACPALAMRLTRTVGGQWRMAVRHILDMRCRSAPERLAAFLLKLVDAGPRDHHGLLPMSKRDLAARIGVRPETLSRSLQMLADNGLFLRGNRILIRDRSKIEAFCGPDPYAAKAETALDVFAL
jgi:CRP/FNR family transcriptional activator FtrB